MERDVVKIHNAWAEIHGKINRLTDIPERLAIFRVLKKSQKIIEDEYLKQINSSKGKQWN